MSCELWYPSLHPPIEHLLNSLIYGEGFASVLPSWSLRESHPAWEDLELLQDAGLYTPYRLADMLESEGMDRILRARLMLLAERSHGNVHASPTMAAWSESVLRASRDGRPPRQWQWRETTSIEPEQDRFEVVPTSMPAPIIRELTRDFGLESIDFRYLRAPQEVVDAIVEEAVLYQNRASPRIVPTTYGPITPTPNGQAMLGWSFILPQPPDHWTLRDALSFRQEHAEPLARLRQLMDEFEPPRSPREAAETLGRLSRRMKRDLRKLEADLEADSGLSLRRTLVKAAAATAIPLLTAPLPDLGLLGDIGVDVAATLVEPSVVGAAGTGLIVYNRWRADRAAR